MDIVKCPRNSVIKHYNHDILVVVVVVVAAAAAAAAAAVVEWDEAQCFLPGRPSVRLLPIL